MALTLSQVALVEGLYHVFKSILGNFFVGKKPLVVMHFESNVGTDIFILDLVPDDRVFEFSVHLWGMITKFSDKVVITLY